MGLLGRKGCEAFFKMRFPNTCNYFSPVNDCFIFLTKWSIYRLPLHLLAFMKCIALQCSHMTQVQRPLCQAEVRLFYHSVQLREIGQDFIEVNLFCF